MVTQWTVVWSCSSCEHVHVCHSIMDQMRDKPNRFRILRNLHGFQINSTLPRTETTETMFFCFIFWGVDISWYMGYVMLKLNWSGTQLYWFRIFSSMFLHFLTCSYSFLYFPSWETHILCWMGHSVFSSAQHPWSPPSAPLHLVLLWLDVENPMGKSNRKMICKCGCSTSMLVYRRVHIKLYIIYTCAQKKDIKLSNWGPIIDITIKTGWSVKVLFFRTSRHDVGTEFTGIALRYLSLFVANVSRGQPYGGYMTQML